LLAQLKRQVLDVRTGVELSFIAIAVSRILYALQCTSVINWCCNDGSFLHKRHVTWIQP